MLNLLPLLRGRRADLHAGEEDLVTVLPHDEGTDGADEPLNQVQYDLEQEVHGEGPRDLLAVADPVVGESASYGVAGVQCAHAGVSHRRTAHVTGLRVVVSSERHDRHRDDQANGAQDKVQEL